MIQMTTKSLLAIIAASNAMAIELDRTHARAEKAHEDMEDAHRNAAALDMENNEMQLAAADLSRSYTELQEYVGAKEEESVFLRSELRRVSGLLDEQSQLASQAIVALKDGVPLVLTTSANVARLITAMTIGNKGQIGEAVRALLPDLGLHDAIQLAVDAVKNASGIIDPGEEEKPVRYTGAQRSAIDGPVRRDTIPFEVVKAPPPDPAQLLDEAEEPTQVMPRISVQPEPSYPINGASIG